MVLRVILFLWLATAVYAVPRPDMQEQLRRLVRLPRVQFSPPLRFHPLTGLVPFPDSLAVRSEIDELRKEARANPRSGNTHLRIAQLHQSIGNRGEALTNYLLAREALRRELIADERNVETLCALAEALIATEAFSEAEHHLRTASSQDSQHAGLALARGKLHVFRAWKKLVPDEDVLGSLSFEASLNEAAENPPSTEQVHEISRDIRAAEQCYTQALALEGDKSQLHREIGVFRYIQAGVERFLRGLGDDSTEPELRENLFPFQTQQHFQSALEAPGVDAATAILAALVTVYRTQHQLRLEPHELAHGNLWSYLNEQDRRSIRNALAVLERIADSNEKAAPSARDYLGCFKFLVMGDLTGAEQNLRQAIAGGVNSERAWDYLSCVFTESRRAGELVRLSEERVQKRSSTRNEVLLANAHDRAGQFETALFHALAALQINANDFLANLTLANLLLKSPEAQLFMGRVQECLTKAEKNLGPHPAFENMFDLAMSKTIFYALSNDLDRARKILQEWVGISGESKDLQAAIEVIGY